MNVFPIEPKFEIGTKGFKDDDDNGNKLDLLNRGEFGQRLTNLVDSTEQPLVIALDGPWGSGKSHFLKLWAGAHKKPDELGGKAEVIYFDAFEHDFLDDPLVSLIGRLADEAAPRTWGAAAVETLKKSAFPLVKMVSRVGLAVATYGATEIAKPVVDVAIAKVSETTDEAIGQFWENETSRIKAMQGFRDALEALTKNQGGTTQKIVFIIDELDRCRPDYALQLLEIIKHFFSVPNVHFVLGANLSELENSVKARYGARINARKYLQKFVMLEMRLPAKTDVNAGYATPLAYFSAVAHTIVLNNDLRNYLREGLEQISESASLTIRDVQRVLSVIGLAQVGTERLSTGYSWLLFDVALLKVLAEPVYRRLRQGSVSFHEIELALALRMKAPSDYLENKHRRSIIWAIALDATEELLSKGFKQDDTDRFRSVFSDYGYGCDWREAEKLFASHLDTFTLPTP